MKITKALFGKLSGKDVYIYTMSNDTITAKVLSYGGTLQSLIVDGKDLVCGYDTLEGYTSSAEFHGALVGRYANRIAKGKFTLDGVEYTLATNDGENHLHGGTVGFDKRIWNVTQAKADEEKITLVLEIFSPDMEEGYPGNLNVKATYTLSGRDFSIRYEAVSDKKTTINLTNHSYFNMNGIASGDSIENQELAIFADTFSEVDSTLIPTNDAPVAGTPFDFTVAKKVGTDIDDTTHPQIVIGGGYDHNFNLSGEEYIDFHGKQLRYAAMFAGSPLKMHLYTNCPAIQFYSGNGIAFEGHPFKGGVEKTKRLALCLETQFAPNSPNKGASFFDAGEKYDYTTLLRFE